VNTVPYDPERRHWSLMYVSANTAYGFVDSVLVFDEASSAANMDEDDNNCPRRGSVHPGTFTLLVTTGAPFSGGFNENSISFRHNRCRSQLLTQVWNLLGTVNTVQLYPGIQLLKWSRLMRARSKIQTHLKSRTLS
jgi:hypothetical protein